jgi:hypothetical protein
MVQSAQSDGPLRVGILLDTLDVPAWVCRMLEIVQASDYARISLVIHDNSPAPKTGFFRTLHAARKIFLYRLYMRLERMVRRKREDACTRRDLSPVIDGTPVLEVVPRRLKYSDIIEDEDVAKIREHDLDVILVLGFRLLKGGILQSARYGTWSFHHGDHDVLRGQPSCFWEVFEHHPVTGAMLHIIDERIDNGLVLAKAYSSTNLYSVCNNRNRAFWKCLHFVPRKLEELHRLGADEFFRRTRQRNGPFRFYDHRLYKIPGNAEFLVVAARHVSKTLASLLGKVFFREEWKLLYGIDRGMLTSLFRFKYSLAPPRGLLYADPHVVLKDDRYFVFFEVSPSDEERGHIAVITIEADGTHSEPETVLERPYHLAYPLVLEWEGEYYMIPDSGHNRSVDAYRCDDFPTKWSFYRTLMNDVMAVDPTIFHHGERWWMFLSMKKEAAASYSDDLYLFYADSPVSDTWLPHPLNPIVSDVRKARSGGQVLKRAGKLFRVSQNCARSYGKGINLHEIVTLTEDAYEERDVQSIKPAWKPSLTGLHTLAHAGDLTVIDVRERRPRWL